MTVEEIKAKHQPRQLENQVEFDAIMSDINQQQGELKIGRAHSELQSL